MMRNLHQDRGAVGQDCDRKNWQRVLNADVALRNDEVPNNEVNTEW